MQLRSLLPAIVNIVSLIIIIVVALSGLPRSFAAEQPSDVPAWLRAHVGDGEGQIAQVVLQRARALYLQKVSEGAVKNPCYFAMDATRPAGFGRRFYVICEADRSFRAISAGHGNGRNLKGIVNFANGIRCAKNFSNAMDSKLTTGGAYMTDETITSFKGYYRDSAGKYVAFSRSFVQFDGEGDTANARPRAIGGHPAVLLRGVCLRKDPDSRYANAEGYVPFGKLVNYAGGRSNGCTSWSPSDAGQIIPMVKDNAIYRTPVLGDFPNEVVGVLYTKDLLAHAYREKDESVVAQIMKEPVFVEPGMPLEKVFKRLRQRRVHIAFLATDEKTITGVITMEDILEHIFGEIWEGDPED